MKPPFVEESDRSGRRRRRTISTRSSRSSASSPSTSASADAVVLDRDEFAGHLFGPDAGRARADRRARRRGRGHGVVLPHVLDLARPRRHLARGSVRAAAVPAPRARARAARRAARAARGAGSSGRCSTGTSRRTRSTARSAPSPSTSWTIWRWPPLTHRAIDRREFAPLAAANRLAGCWSKFGKWDTVYFPQFLGVEARGDAQPTTRACASPYRPEFSQPAGVVHGGVIMTLIDTVVVPAIGSGYDEPRQLFTIDLSVRFLAPIVERGRGRRGLGRAAGPLDRVLRRRGARRGSSASPRPGTLVYKVSSKPHGDASELRAGLRDRAADASRPAAGAAPDRCAEPRRVGVPHPRQPPRTRHGVEHRGRARGRGDGRPLDRVPQLARPQPPRPPARPAHRGGVRRRPVPARARRRRPRSARARASSRCAR